MRLNENHYFFSGICEGSNAPFLKLIPYSRYALSEARCVFSFHHNFKSVFRIENRNTRIENRGSKPHSILHLLQWCIALHKLNDLRSNVNPGSFFNSFQAGR